MFDEKRIDEEAPDIKPSFDQNESININKYIESYIQDISNIEYENSKLEKQCIYNGICFLSKSLILNNEFNVFIVPYYIQNTEYNPFLYFLLEKQKPTNQLNFIKIKDKFDDETSVKESIKKSSEILISILKKYPNFQEEEFKDLEYFKKRYSGYFKENSNIYLFYDISNINILENVTLNSYYTYFFSLIYEIITAKHVIGIPVNSDVYDFFKSNPQFLILVNKFTDEFINTPVVLYSGNTEKKTLFESVFGVTKSEIFEEFGAVYKFYSFEDSLLISEKENKKVYGVSPMNLTTVRLAVFCETILKITSFKMLYDKETQTTWNNTHDSLYFNVPDIFEYSPIICIKQYNQQIPISMNVIKNINYNI